MKLTLVIQLGNDAMRTGVDVGEALRGVANIIENFGTGLRDAEGNVRDLNGNTVGRWEVVE